MHSLVKISKRIAEDIIVWQPMCWQTCTDGKLIRESIQRVCRRQMHCEWVVYTTRWDPLFWWRIWADVSWRSPLFCNWLCLLVVVSSHGWFLGRMTLSMPRCCWWLNDWLIASLLTVILLEYCILALPSVLWHCWFGGRKGIRPVKTGAVGCWCGYLSGARCWLAYGPADATTTHCLLLQ